MPAGRDFERLAPILFMKDGMVTPTHTQRFWKGLPPWILIGAVVVLFPIFGFIALENIHRQKENSTRLLLEKGAALIRSFEAGTRTGMGLRWGNAQLQKLLFETAQQSDIVYLLVADAGGTIVAHNDPAGIGGRHPTDRDPGEIALTDTAQWRVVEKPDGRKIFEVFRKFAPTGGPMGMMHHGRMMQRGWFRSPPGDRPEGAPEPLSIFVGLDMTAIEAARKADAWHFLLMVFVLLLIGSAGIVLLFLFQGYRSTRASLSRIKAFSDTLVEKMPIGLIAVDSRKRVASINTAGGAILRIHPEGAAGTDVRDLLPDPMLYPLEGRDAPRGPVEREVECRLPDGSVLPLELSATRLADETGNTQGHLILFKDLSEVKALREEIARTQRLATVGRLAAGVAHEIRNPLSSIKGFATYFRERYREKAEDQHISGIMIQEVDRLNRVVGQLLEFARPVIITKKPTALRSLIEDTLKLVERQAAAGGITIEAEFPAAPAVVPLDPDKINQVFLNLFLNAIESMEDGGVLRVTVAAGEKPRRIEVKVSDTGVGISESDLSSIFDPYFTTKPTGTGLGLAIAHNIVQGHNGEIRAESRSGQGTTFTVLFPDETEAP